MGQRVGLSNPGSVACQLGRLEKLGVAAAASAIGVLADSPGNRKTKALPGLGRVTASAPP
ncbi:hypothetical protein [Streptomyces sp900116325]|uniref:hypothetical protein n=1 Tax=Streptomyces sp. 900116325 TaxID=3154295 RepID=UPI0033A4CD04